MAIQRGERRRQTWGRARIRALCWGVAIVLVAERGAQTCADTPAGLQMTTKLALNFGRLRVVARAAVLGRLGVWAARLGEMMKARSGDVDVLRHLALQHHGDGARDGGVQQATRHLELGLRGLDRIHRDHARHIVESGARASTQRDRPLQTTRSRHRCASKGLHIPCLVTLSSANKAWADAFGAGRRGQP